jgi:catechol 2,3-dioxygenase-like lactoylglutathione lyase family enzyme
VGVKSVTLFKISCGNLERSAAFYERLGFTSLGPPILSEAPWLGDLYGVPGARVRAQHLAAGGDPKRGRLELIEWANPKPARDGADVLGGGMLAMASDDLVGDYETLSQAGVRFESPPVSRPGPAGVTWLVNLRDPDGLPIQFSQFVKADAEAAG